jgi:type I restriction enzyme, R subunit
MGIKGFIESHVEEAALQWLEELHYEVDSGSNLIDVTRERKTYEEIILVDRLLEALTALNPSISSSVLEDAIREIKIPKQVSILENNRAFHKMITDGLSVSYYDKNNALKHTQLRLFDFDKPNNNNFLAVNQFTVVENRVEKRPDIVVFVNGIPLVVFELKTASDENVSVSSAYRQIKNYQKAIESLFVYNAFNVISDGIIAKVGTITSQEDRYTSWRTIDGDIIAPSNANQLETLIKGMFDKARLLDIIKQFILFQKNDNDYTKILAGYHQYHAVNTALTRTIDATSENGDRKIGVIWHTQGSGKSLSMVFYAGKLVLSNKLSNPTIVVLTDRNDLDDQLFLTFDKSRDLIRSIPTQADSRAHLRELLNGRSSGGIIFTTIQKFSPDDLTDNKPLTTRKNVIVLADEAHRSQYGFSAKVVQSKEEVYEKYGFAKYMRDSLPNASYIGFTGTPIELTDKNTRAVFGDYIDIYDMSRAVEDHTTVKVFYESRIAKLNLVIPKDDLDDDYEEITEDQDSNVNELIKRKWARLEAIVGSKSRIETVAKDIVNHFETRQAAMETSVGKAMIVAMSRRIAVEIYNAIIKLRPEWHSDDLMKGKIKVVMTGSSSDPGNWQDHVGNKQKRETLSKRMKDNNDELQIAIVRDMWLTGFDVPSLHTMYVDKPMQGHNLMQAIARVNRVFGAKQGGLVVDYIGIASKLKEALQVYTEQDQKQTGIDTSLAVKTMLERIDVLKELLHKHDYSKYFKGESKDKLQVITETINFVLGLPKKEKDNVIRTISDITKAYGLCATTFEAEAHNVEIGFYKVVRAGALKLLMEPPEVGPDSKKKKGPSEELINQLISDAIKSDQVIDVLDEMGIKRPELSILSEEFLEKIKASKTKNIAIELLKRLIKGNIRQVSRKTIIQSRKFSEMLEGIMNKYYSRLISSAEVIDELIKIAKEIMEVEKLGKDTGLSVDEFAFYEALASNMTAKEVMGIQTLKKIAIELTEKIKSSRTVDWNIRSSIRAKIQFEIKVLLKKYKYPPDDPKDPNNYEKSIQLIMDQTELLASEIS